MIGIDKNILVRYVTQDDPVQSAKATQLIEGLTEDHPGFISMVTMVEPYGSLTVLWAAKRANCSDHRANAPGRHPLHPE